MKIVNAGSKNNSAKMHIELTSTFYDECRCIMISLVDTIEKTLPFQDPERLEDVFPFWWVFGSCAGTGVAEIGAAVASFPGHAHEFDPHGVVQLPDVVQLIFVTVDGVVVEAVIASRPARVDGHV